MTKNEILEILKDVSKRYNIDYDLAYNIIKAESNFKPNARSSAGAIGLGQLMPKTYDEIRRKLNYTISSNPYDVESNLNAFGYYFGVEIPRLLKIFGYDDTIENRLRAYNAGIGKIKESYNIIETNNYVANILGKNNTDQFTFLSGLNNNLIIIIVGLICGVMVLK